MAKHTLSIRTVNIPVGFNDRSGGLRVLIDGMELKGLKLVDGKGDPQTFEDIENNPYKCNLEMIYEYED